MNAFFRLSLLTAGLLGGEWRAVAESHPQPNVIVIMADDFGYECVAANGSTSYQTPHLDRLARQGMRFTHAYAQPLCTPTRVQLMTGQSNVRNYVRFGHLARDQRTFAHLLGAAGYATAIVGKWQLGREVDAPKHFGFTESCLWQHTRRPPRYANPGLEINGKPTDFQDGTYGPERVTEYALDFMTRHRDQPFLLYYPMILTHGPFQPTPDHPAWSPRARGEKRSDPKYFAAMVHYADQLVGKLVAKVAELGLSERTLILFLGDNGTHRRITSRLGNKTIVGGKGKLTDAGTHVPLLAAWPGTIPAGQVCHDLVDTTDFLPTLCAAARVKVPDNRPIDGQSFLPQLRGEVGSPRKWIYCWYARNPDRGEEPRQFARDQRYKLYNNGKFFDVMNDPFEQRPLPLAELDDKAQETRGMLHKALQQYQDARPTALR